MRYKSKILIYGNVLRAIGLLIFVYEVVQTLGDFDKLLGKLSALSAWMYYLGSEVERLMIMNEKRHPAIAVQTVNVVLQSCFLAFFWLRELW